MANLSDLTRKEQVLVYLRARTGLWVDGSELATEAVGGSEGLRRLRELEDEYNIQRRKHPDPDRDVWQYRLLPGKKVPREVSNAPASPPEGQSTPDVASRARSASGNTIVPQPAHHHAPPVDHVRQRELARRAGGNLPADTSNLPRTRDALRRKEDGTFEYVPPQAPLVDPQLTIPVEEPAQPPEARFSRRPAKIDYGSVAICPRCRSKTTRGRTKKKDDDSKPTMEVERRRKKNDDGSMPLVDEDGVLLFRDPHSRKPKPCERCNGYGIVPNQGPVAFTRPTGTEKPAPLALEDEAPSEPAFPE